MQPSYARYDVSDLAPAQLTSLGGLLARRNVAHAIERGVLLVFAADERRVDAALAELERAGAAAR